MPTRRSKGDGALKLTRLHDEPDFINADGAKWWAINEPVWMVELASGEREYVVLEEGRPVYASTQYDAIGLWLELRGLP